MSPRSRSLEHSMYLHYHRATPQKCLNEDSKKKKTDVGDVKAQDPEASQSSKIELRRWDLQKWFNTEILHLS